MRKFFIIIISMILVNCFHLYAGEDAVIIDSMDSQSGWQISVDDQVVANLLFEKGKDKNSVGFSYDFSKGNWAQINKNIGVDFTDFEYITMYVKTEGSVNNLEVKLVDEDGSNFGIKLINYTTFGKWKLLKLTKYDFKYMWGGDKKLDLKKIASIWIAVSKASGGKGKVLIDDIKMKKAENLLTLNKISTKLIIDNFERSDPYQVYTPVINDKSDLKLSSSRSYTVEGNYSMEMYYKLLTDSSMPSSVQAVFNFRNRLNWGKVDSLNLWIRGDSSRNIFSVVVVDGNDNMWEYTLYRVLYDSKWSLVRIPLNRFKLISSSSVKIFDKEFIKSVIFIVKGNTTDEISGKVYIDKLYVSGKNLNPDDVVPEVVKLPVVLKRPQGNVDINGTGMAEYKWNPENSHLVYSTVKLRFNAKVLKFGVYTELFTKYVEFGKATYIKKENNVTSLIENKPGIEITSIQISIKEPIDYISDILIGSLYEDFSDYTYSLNHTDYGTLGYKGIKIQGGMINLSYRLMVIKKIFGSYLGAGELTAYTPYFYVKGIYVYDNNLAHIAETGLLSETTVKSSETGDFESKIVSREKTYTVELGRDFFNNKMHVALIAGENYYKEYANAEYQTSGDELQDYIYNYSYDKPKVKVGQLYKLELRFINPFWDYFELNLHFRDIDKDYKPENRKSPNSFDEMNTGAYGTYFRISQAFAAWRYAVAAEGNLLFRKEDKKYYRNWLRFGGNINNIYNLNFGLYGELIKQNDKYYLGKDNTVSYPNQQMKSIIFQLVYNPTSKLRILEEQRIDYIFHPSEDKTYNSLRFYLLAEYYINYNAQLKFEGVWFKYGSQYWEPHTSPYDDNFYKFYLEINF